jgi:hypothetical protein
MFTLSKINCFLDFKTEGDRTTLGGLGSLRGKSLSGILVILNFYMYGDLGLAGISTFGVTFF